MALGTIIGAGLGLASSIVGNISAARARRRARRRTEQALRDNKAWYDRRYNEDATRRADANYLLTKTAEAVRNRNQQAKARAALMGGSQEAVTAAQEANAQATSDTAAKIAAAGEARKDRIEQQYLSNKRALENQQNQYDQQTADNIATTTSAALKTAGEIASNLDSRDTTDGQEPVVAGQGGSGATGAQGGGGTGGGNGSWLVNGMGMLVPDREGELVRV